MDLDFASTCVFTDCEPDDILALVTLKTCAGMAVRWVIVGEGNPAQKVERVTPLIRELWHDAVVLQGMPSDKLFPGETSCATAPSSQLDAVSAAVKEATAIVCLKPPRELVAILDHGPSTEPWCPLVIYGSFNFRAAGYKDVLRVFRRCSRVIVYESRGGTDVEARNINPTTAPGVFEALDALDAAAVRRQLLLDTCQQWDADVLRDCAETCDTIAATKFGGDRDAAAAGDEQFKRNASCAAAVTANFGRQFVAADPVLAAALVGRFSWSAPCARDMTLSFPADESSYPTFISPSGSQNDDPQACRVTKLVRLPWEHVVATLAKALQAVM